MKRASLLLAVLLSGCSWAFWSDVVEKLPTPTPTPEVTPTPTPEHAPTPTPAPARLPAPEWLTASPDVEAIVLSWYPVWPPERVTGYEVRRDGAVAMHASGTDYIDQPILDQHCYVVRAIDEAGELGFPSERACATAKSGVMPDGEPMRITRVQYLLSGMNQDICYGRGESCVPGGGIMRIVLHVDVPLPERIDFWERAWRSTWTICGSTLKGQRGVNPKNVIASQGDRVTVGCSDYRATGGLSALLSPPPGAPSGGCRWTFKLPGAGDDAPPLEASGVVDIVHHDRPMPDYDEKGKPKGCN